MLNKAYEEVELPIREDWVAGGASVTFGVKTTKEKSDKTSYYNVGGIEVIDFIKAKLTPEQYKGYLLGNIYKYSGRCQYKGEYKKDIKKLNDYINWLIEHDSNR